MANILPIEKQVMAIHALAEGTSIRAIERMTNIHRDTIMRLGVKVGQACQVLLDEKMQNLSLLFGDIVELDAPWTIEHLQKQNVPIQVGVKIRLFGDDVEADAVIVEFQYNPDRPKFLGAKIVEGTLINVPFPPPGSN